MDTIMNILRPSALALAVLCAVAAVMAGFGTRWGMWHFRTGFMILTWAAYGGLAHAGPFMEDSSSGALNDCARSCRGGYPLGIEAPRTGSPSDS